MPTSLKLGLDISWLDGYACSLENKSARMNQAGKMVHREISAGNKFHNQDALKNSQKKLPAINFYWVPSITMNLPVKDDSSLYLLCRVSCKRKLNDQWINKSCTYNNNLGNDYLRQ